jgi:hypothetical protein
MRNKWGVKLAVFISLILTMASLLAAAKELKLEGLIDVDYPNAREAKVHVNITGNLFSLAAKIIGEEDPEVSELLAKLKAVNVRIYSKAALGLKEAAEARKFYESQLKREKWDVLVRVKDKNSKVSIHMLTKGDIVSGVVVLVGNSEELVVVNLAGEIDITKLSKIEEITDVKLDLPELNLRKRSRPERN